MNNFTSVKKNKINKKSRVCAIVILYQGFDHISRCIEALLSDASISKVIVIDNNSTDLGPKICADYPVDLISLKSNYGFGKANNIGVAISMKEGFDYFFLVNQDVYIEKECVSTLIESHNDMGLIDCVLCSVQMDVDMATIDHNFMHYMKNQLPYGVFQKFQSGRIKRGTYFGHFFNAAAWLIPLSVVQKVGVFDPLFPHYREDEDYAGRCAYHGIPFVLDLASRVAHNRSQSGFIRLEERNWSDQVHRIHVRQLYQFKNIRISLIGTTYKSLRFFIARLLYAFHSRDLSHLTALTVATLRTIRVMPKVIKHRTLSKEKGSFLLESKRLIEDLEL